MRSGFPKKHEIELKTSWRWCSSTQRRSQGSGGWIYHRCYSPWVSQNKRWLGRFPLDSSWRGGQTCTRCPVGNTFLSGIPDKPPMSATLCPGSASYSSPFWTRQEGAMERNRYPANAMTSVCTVCLEWRWRKWWERIGKGHGKKSFKRF